MDFLAELFLKGIQPKEQFLEAFLTNSFWVLLICLVVVYLMVLVILLTPMYVNSNRVRELIDAEERIKLIGAWAVFSVMVCLVGTVGWIYWRALLPSQSSVVVYLRPLGAHVAVLFLLFLLWLGLYFSIRQDSKTAQRSLE